MCAALAGLALPAALVSTAMLQLTITVLLRPLGKCVQLVDDGKITAGKAELGARSVVRARRWGAITEHRIVLASDLELDVGIGEPSWAATTPVDPGTRRVVSDGMRIVHDPDGLLRALIAACAEPSG